MIDKVKIKDAIRTGNINYVVGDLVLLARRKINGYPKFIKNDTLYKIISIENDFIIIGFKNYQQRQTGNRRKVHKSYLVPLEYRRNDLIDKILE